MDDKLNFGELDTKIEILECIISKGDKGQKVYSFNHHSHVWAKVVRSTDEMVSNGNLNSVVDMEVTCYKIPGLTTRWKVNFEGCGYEIVGIDPISRTSPLNRLSLKIVE